MTKCGGQRFSQQRRNISRPIDVTNGLKYMHGRLMVHGDLKGVHFSRLQLDKQSVARVPQANVLINRDP